MTPLQVGDTVTLCNVAGVQIKFRDRRDITTVIITAVDENHGTVQIADLFLVPINYFGDWWDATLFRRGPDV